VMQSRARFELRKPRVLSTSLRESNAVNASEGIEVGKQITVLAAKTQDEHESKGEDVEDARFETVAEAKKRAKYLLISERRGRSARPALAATPLGQKNRHLCRSIAALCLLLPLGSSLAIRSNRMATAKNAPPSSATVA